MQVEQVPLWVKAVAPLWSEKLASVFAEMGFKHLASDPSVYLYERDGLKVIVPVWVDDMTIAAKAQSSVDWVKSELKKHFKIRELGPISFLMGVHIQRDRSKRLLTLSQQ